MPCKVPGSKLPTEGGKPLVPGYVLSVHDFCHDSANQASLLALAAPKIQSSRFKVQEAEYCLHSYTPTLLHS